MKTREGERIEGSDTRESKRQAARVELARRARDGDRSAFDDLWSDMTPTLHGILLAMVPVQDVADLLQEVSLKVLRNLVELRDIDRIGPWMCSIARNRGRDALRRGIRGPDALPEDLAAPRTHDPGTARDVMAILRSMPDAYREPLVLRLVEGLPGPEIAARMGMTHGSLRVNLCRGMKLLRERMEREGIS